MIELIPIPEPIYVTTGGEHNLDLPVGDIIEGFFLNASNYVIENYRVEKVYFERKWAELAYPHEARFGDVRTSQVTDEKINNFLYHGIPLAHVLELRDDQNWIWFTFHRNFSALEQMVKRK